MPTISNLTVVMSDLTTVVYRINDYVTVGAASAYDCCVACQTTNNCAAGCFYQPGPSCQLYINPTGCNPSYNIATIFTDGGPDTDNTAFNGPCGNQNVVAA